MGRNQVVLGHTIFHFPTSLGASERLDDCSGAHEQSKQGGAIKLTVVQYVLILGRSEPLWSEQMEGRENFLPLKRIPSSIINCQTYPHFSSFPLS